MKMKKLVSAIAALAMSVSSFTAFAAAGDEVTVLSNALTDAAALTNTDAYTWGADVAGMVSTVKNTWNTDVTGVYLTNSSNTANNYTDKSFVTFTEAVGDATHKVNVSYDLHSIKDKGQAVTNYILSYYDATGALLFSIADSNGSWSYSSTLTYTTTDGTATASLPAHTGKGSTGTTSFEVTFADGGNLLTIDGSSYAFVGGGIKDIKLSVSGGADQSRGVMLTNYSVKTTEAEAAKPVGYTFNYTLNGESVATASDASFVGSTVTSDTVIIAEDGTKYFTTDDATLSMTLVDGENVLDIPVRAANIYKVSINAVADGFSKTINSYDVVEGNGCNYTYPRYVIDGTNLYKLAIDACSGSIGTVTADQAVDIAYALDSTGEYTFYEVDGAYTTRNTTSNGSAGGSDAGFTVPADGIYDIAVNGYGGSANRTLTVHKNSVEGEVLVETTTLSIYAGGTTLTATGVELKAGDIVWVEGSASTAYVDYVLLKKTAELPVAPAEIVTTIEVVDSFDDGYEGAATALTATLDVPAELTYDTVTVAMADGSASVTKTAEADGITVVSGGTVVYGIIVNAIVEAAALTVVAE